MAGVRHNDNGARRDHVERRLHSLHWRQEPLLLEPQAVDRHEALRHPLRRGAHPGRLRQPESRDAILRHSPSGKVPALKANGLVVFYSLAILEYLAERHLDLHLWPSEIEARALARCISAEMHSGFVTLRNDISMELLARLPTPPIG